MDDSNPISKTTAPSAAQVPLGSRHLLGRLRRLVVKELREILRDRRTIITLVVMPILIYPLLAVVFQRFLFTSVDAEQQTEYLIGVESTDAKRRLEQQLEIGGAALQERGEMTGAAGDRKATLKTPPPSAIVIPLPDDELRNHVATSSLHIVALARRALEEGPEEGLHVPMTWELVYRAGAPTSEAALHFVESRLQAFSESHLDQQLQDLDVVAALPAATERHPIRYSGAPSFSLAALIPLILVLMTVTGAVYPAIDLTAGERERGTLETLIAAPVPRLGLLMAKYVAVLTVALLTALVNIAGMTITAHSTGLGETLFGGGMTFSVVIKVLLLLGLFAAFFSAILLALTSCARSFKEAQAYIIPLMLVCLVPGVLCLLPGLEFTGWMAVTPLVNIVMLGRDLLEGGVAPMLAVAAVCSTLFYIAAAVALAARIFGTDAILYGSPSTWSDLVRRPTEPQPAPSVSVAMLGLALMFATYFVLGSGLTRSQDLPMSQRLVVIGLVTAAVFGGIPIVLATLCRVRWTSGLGLRPASLGALFAATLLGFALWPFAYELFLLSEASGLSPMGQRHIDAAQAMVAEWNELPLLLILVSMAIVPGVFEELCFRGFVFAALRNMLAADRAAITSALIFGIFHEVLFPGRFIASTFLGLVLGWVRARTGSVVPCMLLHTVHNAVLLSLVYHRDWLLARWGIEDQAHLPVAWLALSALGIAASVAMLAAFARRPRAEVMRQAV